MKYFGCNLNIIGSCFDGYIRIWDFHTGENKNSIFSGNKGLIGITFWDDYHLFCGSDNNKLKVIDLEKGIVLNEIKGLKDILCTVQKIEHPL